jgi:hypothetical protein
MEQIRIEYQMKNAKGSYVQTHVIENDPLYAYRSLTEDLINKKLIGTASITSIKRINLQNGYQKITVTYNNGYRTIYTIRN